MLERLLILIGLIILTWVGWNLFNRWQVARHAHLGGRDPLLLNLRGDQPALMLFTADYCYPCKSQQRPNIQRLIEQLGADQVQFIQVDVEADPAAAQRWGVMSLPTTYVLNGQGQPQSVYHGVTSVEKLRKGVEALR